MESKVINWTEWPNAMKANKYRSTQLTITKLWVSVILLAELSPLIESEELWVRNDLPPDHCKKICTQLGWREGFGDGICATHVWVKVASRQMIVTPKQPKAWWESQSKTPLRKTNCCMYFTQSRYISVSSQNINSCSHLQGKIMNIFKYIAWDVENINFGIITYNVLISSVIKWLPYTQKAQDS